ncbi:response regulator [Gorillibacterium sp. sgz5001074]|uniref:response regulator n=1 Tax=Gorillibacterium sp. sgz5001074 TaxID=3446695 RepID=UPI003F67BE76
MSFKPDSNLNSAERDITLVVIDDIRSVTRGIREVITPEVHGVRVAGTAGNGLEGLRLVLELRPDIVLTDIRMPHMDGLEMTRSILEEHPGCKILLLSGYTDFEYAQEAIRLGAVDFLTKPFLKDTLVQAVLKAKKLVEDERHRREEHLETERRMKESLPLLRQEYLHLLLRYGSDAEKQAERWEYLNLTLERERFGVFQVSIDSFAELTEGRTIREAELARFAVQNILEETLSEVTRAVVFREQWDGFVCLLNLPEPSRTEGLEELADRCRENVGRYSRYTVSIGVGHMAERMTDLPAAYSQAAEALSHTFFTGGNSVYLFRSDPSPRPRAAAPRYSPEQEKELFLYLRTGHCAKATALLHEMTDVYAGGRARPDELRRMGYELGLLLYREFTGILTDPAQTDRLSEAVESLRKGAYAGFQGLTGLLEGMVVTGCGMILEQREREADSAVDRAVRYMAEHLDRNLSVQDLAAHVFLSSSYFSNLFKKVKGMTSMQYFTAMRMDRAKAMLLEGRQVQDVALSVGYEDRPYFSDVFKKHFGMTPTEFRQSYEP